MVAHFELKRLLNRGGFGSVWLANDIKLNRQVAFKLPRENWADSHLMHDAKIAAKLRHPNIVTVHEVGEHQGQVFIASEYIEGITLGEEMMTGRLEIGRAVDLLVKLANAAAYAHSHGVIHRDLKPSNVILNAEGEPNVTDFGIAKLISADETISSEGAIVGSGSYMSPEQAMGKTRETDHRADIYALGVIMFEMLTGNWPFRGTIEAVIRQKIEEDAPSPRLLVPSIPADLETICLKCLERDRGKRYQAATELVEELQRFQQNRPIKARPISAMEKTWRWCLRQPAVAGLLVGIVLSLAIGLSSTSYFWMRSEKNASETQLALYRAQLNLIDTRWDNGELSEMKQTLKEEPVRSISRQTDDFAYRYFSAAVKPFRQIVNHGGPLIDVAVSHDGGLFASGDRSGQILVWNASDGQLLRTLEVASGQIGTIEFSPDRNQLASSHSDGLVRIWNPFRDDRVLIDLNHGEGLSHGRFLPEENRFLSADRHGQIRIWDLEKRTVIARLGERKASIEAVRVSPDGNRLAVAYQDGVVGVFDLRSNQLERELPRSPNILSLCFMGDGEALAVGNLYSKCRIYSLDNGKLIHTIESDGAVGDMEYLREINRLAVASSNQALRIYDQNYKLCDTLPTHIRTYGLLAQAADGKSLAVGSADGSVKLLDVASYRHPAIMWHDAPLRDIVFVDDNRVATCGLDGAVHTWDLATGERHLRSGSSRSPLLVLAALSGGKRLAVGGADFSVSFLDLEASKSRDIIPSISFPYAGISGLAYCQSADLLAIGARSGRVQIRRIAKSGEPIWKAAQPDAEVLDLCFAPDRERLAAAFSNQTILVVDRLDGRFVETVFRLDSVPTAMAFYEEGRMLAVGTQTGEILLQPASGGPPIRIIKCHGSRINSLAVLPGETQIVSGGQARDLYLWDLRSGSRIAQLRGHDRQIFSIAVSPDGRSIVSVGLQGDLHVWRGPDLAP